MKLPDSALRLLFRPRVLHSLPGRVRIRIPLATRLARRHQDIVALVVDLIGVPEEIHQVEGSAVTGTLLIRYDQRRLNEKDVLAYLRTLFEIYLRNRETLDRLPADRWPRVRDGLRDAVRGGLRHRLTLDPDLEIRSDALA